MITFSDNAKDIFSAISKELKCKYFVKVNVKAGVRTTKTAVKPVAETAVYIYNKKNELKKEIYGVVSIPPVLRETITDKNQITEMFPELIERSIQLASENLNHKDKLFEIKALKEFCEFFDIRILSIVPYWPQYLYLYNIYLFEIALGRFETMTEFLLSNWTEESLVMSAGVKAFFVDWDIKIYKLCKYNKIDKFKNVYEYYPHIN